MRAEAVGGFALIDAEDGCRGAALSGDDRLWADAESPDPEPMRREPRPGSAGETALRLFAASPDRVALLAPDGRVLSTNATTRGPSDSGLWVSVWTPDESRIAAQAAFDRARCGQAARFQGSDGATWWDVTVTPVIDGTLIAVARDISEQRQAEARQGVLLMEMEHRLKNTLAIVQAVATQTLRNATSLGAAAESLGARMLALAQAHDVLMQGDWASASLRGLVEGAARLHGDGMPERFHVNGPEVIVGPRPALTLALMLHELGTNAAKYGALSNETGRVSISWRIAGQPGQERLRFRWSERGGPPVAPPTRTGFGSRLIERSLVHSFGGSARLRYPPEGAVLILVAPFEAVAAENRANG